MYLSEEYHVHQLAQTQYKCLLLISIVKMTQLRNCFNSNHIEKNYKQF